LIIFATPHNFSLIKAHLEDGYLLHNPAAGSLLHICNCWAGPEEPPEATVSISKEHRMISH
jgi:hypothetical protein